MMMMMLDLGCAVLCCAVLLLRGTGGGIRIGMEIELDCLRLSGAWQPGLSRRNEGWKVLK